MRPHGQQGREVTAVRTFCGWERGLFFCKLVLMSFIGIHNPHILLYWPFFWKRLLCVCVCVLCVCSTRLLPRNRSLLF